MTSKPFSRSLALATAAFIGLFWVLYRGSLSNTDLRPLSDVEEAFPITSNRSYIPNYVHFVFLLEDPAADFPLEFQHFLSVYSALHYTKPQKIIFSTNARESQIARARDGHAGKWARLIFTLPGFEINHVELPTKTQKGFNITHIAHKSDFVRVEAISEYGGIYLDLDVYLLRDLMPLRESGFNAVCGREPGGMMSAGAFMAKSQNQSKMISTWTRQMPEAFDNGWITHSNGLMTQLGEQMVAEPWELLVLDESALAPMPATKEAAQELLAPHPEFPSSLDRLKNGLSLLPEKERPSWDWNWKKTYALHAFYIEELEIEVSPRSILERQSGFARAVYPAVKAMYDEGIVSLDDK